MDLFSRKFRKVQNGLEDLIKEGPNVKLHKNTNYEPDNLEQSKEFHPNANLKNVLIGAAFVYFFYKMYHKISGIFHYEKLPREDINCRNINNSISKESVVKVLNQAFRKLQKDSGIYEDLADKRIAAQEVNNNWKNAVVAQLSNKEIVGVIFATQNSSERDVIGLGPFAVSPKYQNQGMGKRLLMKTVESFLFKGAKSIRLLHDCHSIIQFKLYSQLEFETKDTFGLFSLNLRKQKDVSSNKKVVVSVWDIPPVLIEHQVKLGLKTHPLGEEDVDECIYLMKNVVGFAKEEEIRNSVKGKKEKKPTSFVVKIDGKIKGFSTGFSVKNFSVATCEMYMVLLIYNYVTYLDNICNPCVTKEMNLFVSLKRDPSLVKLLYLNKCYLLKTMNYMVKGTYDIPKGSYCPSIDF